MNNVQVLEGSEAVALAVQGCRPQVIAAFPISPQTHIVESLARMVANGQSETEYLRVESEFSAASAVSGASATGARAYTASSSQGLLLMTEVLYASVGQRLPFVITAANRVISSPISIQTDHQDAISLRDSGLIQLFCEDSQEAYDLHIAAFKIAEDPEILLPTMVCMDGWILTHSYERVQLLPQERIDAFVPPFAPHHFLDVQHPKTWGSYAIENVGMEFKYVIQQTQMKAKERIRRIFHELSGITGRDYEGLIEAYRTKDADIVLLAMGSMAGTAKVSVDRLREEGKRVGLVKIRCYRPFPHEEIWEAVRGAQAVAVMDANFSMGSEGAVSLDLKSRLCGRRKAPLVLDFVTGFGGREVTPEGIGSIVELSEQALSKPEAPREPVWIGLNHDLVIPERESGYGSSTH